MGKGELMDKGEYKQELLKQEFKTWVSIQLLQKNISKKEFAESMKIPFPRVSEAINGTGQCLKYIKQIIIELGTEKDLQRFKELYDLEVHVKER